MKKGGLAIGGWVGDWHIRLLLLILLLLLIIIMFICLVLLSSLG